MLIDCIPSVLDLVYRRTLLALSLADFCCKSHVLSYFENTILHRKWDFRLGGSILNIGKLKRACLVSLVVVVTQVRELPCED